MFRYKISKLSQICNSRSLLFCSKFYSLLSSSNISNSVRLISSTSFSLFSHAQIFATHSSLPPFPSDFEIESVFDSSYWDRLQITLDKRGEKFDLASLRTLYESWQNGGRKDTNIRERLAHTIRTLPNWVHPAVPDGPESNARVVHLIGSPPAFVQDATNAASTGPEPPFAPRSVTELGRALRVLRTDSRMNVAVVERGYYQLGALARLERSLLQFVLERARARGFRLVAVPDVLPAHYLEGAGVPVLDAPRSLVYRLAGSAGHDAGARDNALEPPSTSASASASSAVPDWNLLCLSGTAEMALAALCADRLLRFEDLPLKLCAISRCFRQEVATQEDRLYRVHEFTKLELFGVTAAERAGAESESERLHQDILELEMQIFRSLGLHFRVLDMPTLELGPSACRKFDIEAYMPSMKKFGEVSSTSNCLDYQAKRLGVRYRRPGDGALVYCHTVNGTGLAVPRVLLALLEHYQDAKCYVRLPPALADALRFAPATLAASHVPTARSRPLPLPPADPLRPLPVAATGATRTVAPANAAHEPPQQ